MTEPKSAEENVSLPDQELRGEFTVIRESVSQVIDGLGGGQCGKCAEILRLALESLGKIEKRLGWASAVKAGPSTSRTDGSEHGGQPSKKILIIEDDVQAAKLLAGRLSQSGFAVTTAVDAYGGIRAAHVEKPDLIVLDLMIPAGRGDFVLDNIRKSEQISAVPVLIVTGVKDDKLKSEILSRGADDYVEKPYDGQELVERIATILGLRQG